MWNLENVALFLAAAEALGPTRGLEKAFGHADHSAAVMSSHICGKENCLHSQYSQSCSIQQSGSGL